MFLNKSQDESNLNVEVGSSLSQCLRMLGRVRVELLKPKYFEGHRRKKLYFIAMNLDYGTVIGKMADEYSW